MRIFRICFIVVLLTGYEACAQYVPVRRIPMPQVPMMAGWLMQSGGLCWAVSSRTLAVWREELQTWEVCIRYTGSNYMVTCAPGEHSGLYVLTSTAEIDYVDSLGNISTIGNVGRIRAQQSIVAIPGGPILEAGSFLNRSIVSSALVDGEWKTLDTIPIASPMSIWLTYVRACSTVVMTVIGRLPNWTLDTTSYRYDRVRESWEKMTNALGSVDHVVLANGDILSLSNRRIVRRTACDGVSMAFGPDNAVDKIHHLSDGSILAYIRRGPDTVSSAVCISTDDGATFSPHPAFEGLDDNLHFVVEGADRVLIATAGEKFLRVVGDTAVVIPPPYEEMAAPYPDLVPVAHDASRFLALNTQCCPQDAALYDLDAKRWYGLTFSTGERCSPRYAYSFPHVTVVNDQSMTGLLEGTDTAAAVVRHADGRILQGAALQAVQLTVDTLLLSMESIWYRVDVRTATATVMETDWPRTERGNSIGSFTGTGGGVVTGSQPFRIVVGTTAAWNIGSDSMITDFDRYGILVSVDGGRSWTMSNEGLGTDIHCWGMANRHDTIYALMGYVHSTWSAQAKVYRSEDRGRTWSRMNLLPVEIRNRMRMSIASDGTLYVGGRGLVRSTDGGITWQSVTGSWEETELPMSAIVRNDHLVVATDDGIYVSIEPVTSVKEASGSGSDGGETVHWDGQAFVIQHAGISDGVRIAVYDLTGRMIEVVSTVPGRFVPVAPLPAGPYIVVGTATTLVLVHGR